MGKHEPVVENASGGRQSKLPYQMDLLPPLATLKVAEVLAYGAAKYGENHWHKISVPEHLNHMLAPAFAWLAGAKSDDHVGHLACRALMAAEIDLMRPAVKQPELVDGMPFLIKSGDAAANLIAAAVKYRRAHGAMNCSGESIGRCVAAATSLHWTVDEGKTWKGPVRIDAVRGAYPSMVELPDGLVYCVYYEEGKRSSIRGVRLRVDKGRVQVEGKRD
jgi:hypothetical protein